MLESSQGAFGNHVKVPATLQGYMGGGGSVDSPQRLRDLMSVTWTQHESFPSAARGKSANTDQEARGQAGNRECPRRRRTLVLTLCFWPLGRNSAGGRVGPGWQHSSRSSDDSTGVPAAGWEGWEGWEPSLGTLPPPLATLEEPPCLSSQIQALTANAKLAEGRPDPSPHGGFPVSCFCFPTLSRRN